MSILVNVVNQKMYVSSTMEGIVSGSQQFVKFRFNLSEEWDGLLTFAQFRQNGKAYNQYLDEENAAYLPPEIGVGTFTLMLYGSHNTTIGTTNYLTLKVNDNNFISDASSTDISKSLYSQLVSYVQTLDDAIKNINSSSIQLKPEFVNDISECTDMSKLYVLPDGYIYAYMLGTVQKEEASFGTSEWGSFSAVSTTENAYVFNHIGATLTGKLKSISVKCNGATSVKFAVAHMENGVVTSVDDIRINTRVGENTYVNGVDFYYDGTIQEGDLIGYCRDISCQIYYGTSANGWCYKTTSLTDYTLTAKGYGFAISAVVETSGEAEYMWLNTGHAFVPADYEDRIINVESKVSDHSDAIDALSAEVATLNQNKASSILEVIGTEIDPSIANYADSEKFVIRLTPSIADATLTMEKSEDVNTSAVRQICYVDFTNGKMGFYNKCADGATLTIHQEKAISFSIVSGHEYVVEMIKEDSKYAILRITDALSLETDEISCSEFEVGRGWGSRKYDYTGDAGDITSVKSYIMQQKKTKLLIVGDSYIEGSSLPEFGEDRNNRYAMLLKNAVGGDCFINGRGGAASANILSWFNTYLPEVCQPEYTIVSCGANDSNYENWLARYQSIIAKIEEMGSKPILTTVAAISVSASKDIFGQMNEWIRNSGYDYIDVNLVTSLDYGMTELNPDYFFSDNAHPNSVGHDIIFKRVQIDVPYLFQNSETGELDESKILDGAVTGAKIADDAIDYNHIKEQAVTPEALDREYLRLNLFANVVNDSSFLTLLNSNISESESEEHFKKAVLFVIRQTSEGQLTSIIGAGRCFGFYVSKQEFWFTNLKTNKVYSAVFTDEGITSITEKYADIATGTVTSEKIAEKAVTTEKIANNSIVYRHLGGEIISEENIMPGVVTTSKIGEGAVNTNNINQYAVTRDKIQGQAIDESKILDGAVTGAKIADDAIDYNHIKEQAVTPEALDREYLRLNLFANVVNDSSFLTLLNSNISESESEEHFKKAVLFVIRQTSEGQLTSIIGAGRCFGFYVSKQEFWFTNLKTNKVYSAVFNENELVSVSLLTEQEDFVYAGFFTRTSDLIKYNFEKRKIYSLSFTRGTGEELETNYYFAKIEYNLASDKDELLLVPFEPNGKIFFVSFSTGKCVVDFTADQTYKPTSTNAQSGVAVAEAISLALGDVETLLSKI